MATALSLCLLGSIMVAGDYGFTDSCCTDGASDPFSEAQGLTTQSPGKGGGPWPVLCRTPHHNLSHSFGPAGPWEGGRAQTTCPGQAGS